MPIMPLCIKGIFYAKDVVVCITTVFYAIEFGVKSPCEESWPPLQKVLIHKGKILRQIGKLMGLPLMCLIHRVYPIQVTIFQMENDLGLVQWRKIFTLCSPQKGKVLTSSSDRIPPPIPDFGVKFPLCVFPQGENFTPLGGISYTKLVEDRQKQFQQL